MKKTNYGSLVNDYLSYKNNRDLAEWRLGHEPLLAKVGDIEGLTVLDFGCGPANFSGVLSGRGAKVIGFDIDPKVIEQARLTDPLGDYRVYRGLLAEELKNVAADLVTATFSFCVVPDRELRYILRDMRQLLRPGGKLVIIEPNQETSHGIQYANLHYHFKKDVQSGDYVEVTLGTGENAVLLTDDIYRLHADYRQLLEEAGFTIESMEEPRPGKGWGSGWATEWHFPPFLLITAQ